MRNRPSSPALVVILASVPALPLGAGDDAPIATTPATTVVEPETVPLDDAVDGADALRFGELPENFGWLSDPAQPPQDLVEALLGGKFNLNLRLRLEQVHQDGFGDATGLTGRIRLGYQTKPWHGFSAFGEMEAVGTVDRSLYSVPPAGQGNASRAVIADPEGMELNQGYGRYQYEDLGLDIKAGRQRIILDNQRFVGNVGWRQFEQTFDAFSVKTTLGHEDLELFYAYVWKVKRIFGPDGPDFDSDSHLLNASYTVAPWLKATVFAYLLDFSDSATNSTHTYGVLLTGNVPLDPEQDLAFVYEASFAHQTDAANNPANFDVHYVGVDGKIAKKDVAHVGVGYELLGSDRVNSFRTPLATGHKFNGWADVFLTTPATGLQDLYTYIGGTLPWNMQGKLVFHQFWSHRASTDFGWEIDALVSKKISRNWSVLAKYAYYEGSAFADRNKFWLQTTFQF